jgi:hypothetical protein
MGERTVQQLYPVGAMVGRVISIAAAIVAPSYVVIRSYLTRDEINAPLFCLIALLLVGAASVTVVICSSPLRAPFTASRAAAAVAAANLALVFDAAATFGTNTHIRDDYGPVVIGLIILATAPYRPPRELVTSGLLSAILVGVVALVQAPYLQTPASPFVYAIAAMIPLLILSLGSAAFATIIVRGLERWRRQARIAVAAVGDDGSEWIARSVQQDRVTILNRDVVPFFADLLQRAAVDEADVERARAISDSIRSVMVAEVDRSWLEIVVEQAAATQGVETISNAAIVDRNRLAQLMSTDQRAAVRAFLVALFGHPSFSTRNFSVIVSGTGTRCTVLLVGTLDCPEGQVKSELAPYWAVMRILFADLTVELNEPSLTLMFSYEH